MDLSNMLHEILDIIAYKHIIYYEDYLSFALVCKSWHSSALYVATKRYKHSNGPPSRLPSLILTAKKEDKKFRELFLLSNKSVRKIRLPKAYGQVCKSSCGWLETMGDDYISKLINPLSHEILSLPKIIGPSRVVFVPQSSMVVVVVRCEYNDRLQFCRIGDNKWKRVVEGGEEGICHICDITYYNGRVYSFDFKNFIRACNVFGEDPAQLVYVSRLPKDLFDDKLLLGTYRYILGLDGDDGRRKLLVVIRMECEDKYYFTKSFQVFEYDLENEKWSEVKDLGRKTLFVGYRSSSFWIEDTTGVIKGNCIYYVYPYRDCELSDMGIYHISDGTIEPHFFGESHSFGTPPLWIQSSIHY